ILAAVVIGFLTPSGVSAAPAHGVLIGRAAAAGHVIHKARYYRRHYRRRARYYYPSRPYGGGETIHQLSQENQERAQQNAGPAVGRSDIRLKHDIRLLGHLENGLGYYRFSYNGSDKVYVGVMAQEVQSVKPEAVVR